MSRESGEKRLKTVLVLLALFDLFYGIAFLLFPGMLVAMSGSPEPVNLSWIRWAGGPLLAFAFGAFSARRNPAGQGAFVMAAMLSALLGGLGLLYSKIFDHSTSYAWFHMMPALSCLALFVLLLWARQGAKEILA
jgi:hypothetical protein